jgi:hypothetical protein
MDERELTMDISRKVPVFAGTATTSWSAKEKTGLLAGGTTQD